MGKTTLAVFFGLVMLVAGASGVYAHQAGGVEIGDWESGSVVGQPFKELEVDAEFYAVEIGNMKAWYPPTTIVDFKGPDRSSGPPESDEQLHIRARLLAD